MIYSQSYWNDVKKVILCIPNLEKLYNKTILIAGATGMICSSVAEIIFYLNKEIDSNIKMYFAARSKERIVKRFPNYIEGQDYFYINFDAVIPSEINLITDYIIYGASNADPAGYIKEPVETILSNIIGVNSLLQLASNNNACRFLFISSSEVYGNKAGNNPYKEDDYGFIDILNSRACYPNAKRTAETLCIAYAEEYNADVVIARPGHIYGGTISESDSRASAQFSRKAVSGDNIVMKSAGAQKRSYCYSLDCASAILSILLNGENRNAYNISNKNSIVTIREMAEELAKVSNTKIISTSPSEEEAKGYNMMINSALDSDKLESIGWRPCFDLNMGIKRTFDILKLQQSKV